MTPDEELVETMAELGVVGFNPYCDAVRQPLSGGPRIWYYRDDEIKWVQRTTHPQRRWESPAIVDAEAVKKTLTAAESFDIIDKRLHNTLVSGPLKDASGAHEGIAWGVALLFGHDLRNGRRPSAHSLKAVPGVGDRIASEISNGLYAYKDAPVFTVDADNRGDSP